MSRTISIDVGEQGQLLLYLEDLLESTQEVCLLLHEATEMATRLGISGEFFRRAKEYSELDIRRFVAKAQTLQTLAEVLLRHTESTYYEMIDFDQLLALRITNLLMADPDTPPEFRSYARRNPESAVNHVNEAIQEQNRQGQATQQATQHEGGHTF